MLKKFIALSALAVSAAFLASPAAAGVIVTSPGPDINGGYAAVAPESGVAFSDLNLRGGSLKDASGRVVLDRLGLGHVHRTIGPDGDGTTVPEPATLLLLGSGLTALALRRRRRQ